MKKIPKPLANYFFLILISLKKYFIPALKQRFCSLLITKIMTQIKGHDICPWIGYSQVKGGEAAIEWLVILSFKVHSTAVSEIREKKTLKTEANYIIVVVTLVRTGSNTQEGNILLHILASQFPLKTFYLWNLPGIQLAKEKWHLLNPNSYHKIKDRFGTQTW